MDKNEISAGFRLAFRREGKMINTYLANEGTMDDAELVASIKVSLVEAGEGFWGQYKTLVSGMFKGIIKDTLGFAPSRMDEQPAPEHEKSGRS